MKKLWYKIGLFVVAAAAVVYLLPNESKFNYSYSLGCPWKHEPLIASYDFPILKDKKQVEAEQDSVLRQFQPYYTLDDGVMTRELERMRAELPSFVPDSLLPVCQTYVELKLRQVYAAGILSGEGEEQLKKGKTQAIYIVQNHKPESRFLQEIYTPLTAYRFIFQDVPASLDVSMLKAATINRFLSENLIYDPTISDEKRQEMLKQVSFTAGYVQTGERIVDRGQLVDEHTFQILNSLKAFSEKRINNSVQYYVVMGGQALMVLILFAMLFLYFHMFRPRLFNKLRNIVFFLLMPLLMLGAVLFAANTELVSIYVIPFTMLPVIVRTFFDSRTAFAVHLITILLASFFAEDTYAFIILQVVAGFTALYSLRDLVQRSQLLVTACFVFVAYCATYFALELIAKGSLDAIQWRTFSYFLINGLVLLFAYPLIYILEKIFGYLSNVTLVELSGANNDLMRLFAETAPGSFQHSLQVSNLASDAALKIGANPFLARVGALYHDIGKMTNPVYFTENQSGGINPLNQMSYEEAAQVVISHVDEGVRLAGKYGLPDKIVDFIRSHHGTRKAAYFYNSFKNAYPNLPVNEVAFTYHGIQPCTKEMAILAMADAVEAASHSLTEYSESTINKLVDKIVDGQLAEGLFREAPITFAQMETVKTVFKEKLKNIYHSRISYPELKIAPESSESQGTGS